MSLEIISIISNFITAVVTLIVGLVAWIVYRTQRSDNKKDAANIILLEIQNAERQLKLAKKAIEENKLSEDVFVMQTESWSKYKYLYVRNFDRDEWDAITEFYNNCQIFDQAVMYNNSFFQKNEEQIRVNMQRILGEYARIYAEKIKDATSLTDKKKLEKEFQQITQDFQNKYMSKQGDFIYNPSKPINDAKKYIENLNTTLSQTTVGLKLKKLANYKD